jgi:hypothetical protein
MIVYLILDIGMEAFSSLSGVFQMLGRGPPRSEKELWPKGPFAPEYST